MDSRPAFIDAVKEENPMPQSNSIHIIYTDEEMTQIRGAWSTLVTVLAPKLKNLAPDARKELPKVGERSLVYLNKAANYAPTHPHLVPSFMDLEAFQVDTNAAEFMRENIRVATTLLTQLEDSLTLSLVEAYEAALMFHHNVKAAAKSGEPNAKAIYEDLVASYPGTPRKRSKSPSEQPV